MKFKSLPSREDILQYYVTENHTKNEALSHFCIGHRKFDELLHEYGIKKPRSLVGLKVKDTYSKRAPVAPSKEDLEQLYLTELKSTEELAEIYQVTYSRIRQWLKDYKIKKDPKLTIKTVALVTEKKYGKPFFKSEETKAKTKATCLERFGVENPSFSPDIVKKISEAQKILIPYDIAYHEYIELQQSTAECAKKFGISRACFERIIEDYDLRKNSQQITAGRSKTNLEKYGDINPLLNPEIKARIKQANILKYGVPNPASRNVANFDIWSNRDKLVQFLKEKAIELERKPTLYEVANWFNVVYSIAAHKGKEWELQDVIDINPHRSAYENELVTWLKKDLGVTNIETSNRTILDGREIDIYLPDYKLGIEFNGEFWHSDQNPKYSDHGGRSTKHQEKSLLAEEKGIFLFHIFEHEWADNFTRKNPKFFNSQENIKNRIKALIGQETIRYDARKCQVREIDEQTKKDFLDSYHIQGSDLKSAYCIGLFMGDTLLECMSFRHSKYRKYDWELSRFCSKHGISVRGGASKLFSYFLKNKAKDGDTIVSYNDITKTKGTLYKTLGFQCTSIGSPNYWWVNLDNYDIRSRYQEQAAGETRRMHELGYSRICDAGTRTWVYVKS